MGKRTEETYTLVGIAHADQRGTKRLVGVEAEGMTACPCAQLMVREHSHRELLAAGFSAADADRALDALPVATHNQRGRGTVLIGRCRRGLRRPVTRRGPCRDRRELDVERDVRSAEAALDEFFVVNKAHQNPKFVEDVVRGILASGPSTSTPTSPTVRLSAATQVNYESIHKHDAFAEAFGVFGEFRRELRDGVHVDAKATDVATWLGTRPSPVIA